QYHALVIRPRTIKQPGYVRIHMRMFPDYGDGIRLPRMAHMRHHDTELRKLHGNLVHDQWMSVPDRRRANRRGSLMEQDGQAAALSVCVDRSGGIAKRFEILIVRR